MMLGLEDTFARMSRLGAAEIVTGELLTQSEMLERIAAVTTQDVQNLASDLAARPWQRVLIVPS